MTLEFFGIRIGQENKNRQPAIKEYHINEKELLQTLNLQEEPIDITWNPTTRTLIIKTHTKKNQTGETYERF